MKISDMPHQAENLIEQSEQAHAALKISQQKAAQALIQMRAARTMLDIAQETDEDGNPRGNVSYAKERLSAATGVYYAAIQELSRARSLAEGLEHQKRATANQLDRYSEVSQRNLTVLEMLQRKRFGGNVSGCVADIIGRMNVAEATRDRLLQSMGKAPGVRRAGMAGGVPGGPAAPISPAPYAQFTMFSDRDGREWFKRAREQDKAYAQYLIERNKICSDWRLTQEERVHQLVLLNQMMKQVAQRYGWIKEVTGKKQLFGIYFPDKAKAKSDYAAKLVNRMKESSPLMQSLYNAYSSRIIVADDDYYTPDSGAHYMPSDGFCKYTLDKDQFMIYEQRGIHLDAAADENNECGAGSTFYHESGHMLDHLMGQDRTGRPDGWLSDDADYQAAFQRDSKQILRAWTNMTEEEKQSFIRAMYLPKNASLCDLLNAISNGQIRGKYSHKKEYWKEAPAAIYRESFAHFTEASMGDNYKQGILSQLFPEAWARYNELLSDDTKVKSYGQKTIKR